MSLFTNYDPARVVFTFSGILVQGFMEGTFISVERAEDAFTPSVGAAGDVTRVRNRNRTGSITVTLQAASPSNDQLSTIARIDELFGQGVKPSMVKDLNGTTLIQASNSWIRKIPQWQAAKDASGVEWVFDCAELNMHVGGSLVVG